MHLLSHRKILNPPLVHPRVSPKLRVEAGQQKLALPNHHDVRVRAQRLRAFRARGQDFDRDPCDNLEGRGG